MPKGDYCKIEKNDLINDIMYIFNKDIDGFTRESYLERGKYSRAPIKRIFGTWNKMLKELNIPINCTRNEITKDQVISDANRVFDKNEKLTALIYRREGLYSQPIVDRLFGNFSSLLNEMKLSLNHRSKNMTNNDLLDELKILYNEHGYLTTELINKKFLCCYATLLNRVGPMSYICQILEIDQYQHKIPYFKSADIVISLISDILEETPIKEWTTNSLRNPISGNNLFFDAYFPKSNLVVEYHGKQHFEFVEYFHKTLDGFENRKTLDRFKEEWCKKSNIKFLCIKYNNIIEKHSIEQELKQIMNTR